MLSDLRDVLLSNIFPESLELVLNLWPIWGPFLALYYGFKKWMSYKQGEWVHEQEKILLEVKIPSVIVKSPSLMEVFINILHQAGVGSLTDVYLKGRVRSWYSLELVSNGGEVHFYIWLFAKQRRTVESQLYAQFPEVEIHEVEDYTKGFYHDSNKYKIGKIGHMILTKKDAYPIKTYIDYGLDDDQKEEYKNDPIAPMIEYLGSLKPGEHAWIQILLRAHTKEGFKYGHIFTVPDWKEAAEAEIKDILKKSKLKGAEEKSQDPKFLSESQKETIKAIERSLEKNAFDSMIRVAYFAEKDNFNPANIGGLLSVFKQFSSNTLNGFKPGKSADYDYPWQDFKDRRKTKNEKTLLKAYKQREIFNDHLKSLHDKPFILTTEEIATIYHFPSAQVAATPSLARIPSKKADAPANLPI